MKYEIDRYSFAYETLCKKIECTSIEIDDDGYLNAIFSTNNSSHDPFMFWINDGISCLSIKENYESLEKDIVIAVFNCLKTNFLKVRNVVLDDRLILEKWLIEYDLKYQENGFNNHVK